MMNRASIHTHRRKKTLLFTYTLHICMIKKKKQKCYSMWSLITIAYEIDAPSLIAHRCSRRCILEFKTQD